MALLIKIISATNVPDIETLGKTDPFVVCEFRGCKDKTSVKENDLNPVWNENVRLEVVPGPLKSNENITIKLMDHEKIGRNRLVCQTKLAVNALMQNPKLERNLLMMDKKNRKTDCSVSIQILYEAPISAEKNIENNETGDVVDSRQEEDNELADENDTIEYDSRADMNNSITKRKKPKSRKIRGRLSNKSQDFQIRIKIIEGRQLQGGNIDPVTRITCFQQTKQTRIKKSTNSPFWNEVFFFNFFCSPGELFDEILDFQVFHSKKLRSDSLIGNFKCDIGMIYEAQDHSLINKWLLLSNPEDLNSGASGYIKICATVLGPGDTAPNFDLNNDEEDIESNLLKPSGVHLRPAKFTLNLYRCEDLPIMDCDLVGDVKKFFGSKQKKGGRVDPYFVFSFAGSEVRDRLSDEDTICTTFLRLSDISKLGDLYGFLPTFGPSFVNFYGSPREFSCLGNKYDYMNDGKGEGVCFRGRALLELKMAIEESPDVPSQEISQESLYNVEKFMARRKFKLNAIFYNASLIYIDDAPVEFEVSIGNYGNKLDETVPPSASTTQITNPVFDGSYYHFLPWSSTKPCVSVDCHWEDISFRLESLNSILKTLHNLESNLEQIRRAFKAKLSERELAQLIIITLDRVILDCQKPLPDIIKGQTVENNLDREIRIHRQRVLTDVREQAITLRKTADNPEQAISELEDYFEQLKNIALEPQSSIPDIIIWMISDNERKAFCRIPPNDIFFSPNPDYRGKYCNNLETIHLKFPGEKMENEKRFEIPAQLRLKLWFGLARYESSWTDNQDGEISLFAETYENQVKIMNTWSGKFSTRPSFSDNNGKVKLKKDDFIVSDGWSWVGDWYISPELSMLYDKDSGHKSYIEEVYELQSRTIGGKWSPDQNSPWIDVKGDKAEGKEDVVLSDGWEWKNQWSIDKNKAVDDDGWEYSIEISIGGWGPVEKMYHLCRRRRWMRTRAFSKTHTQSKTEKAKVDSEGWEYAPTFTMKFHHVERKLDMVRRRRWHRQLKNSKNDKPCIFSFKSDEEKKSKEKLAAPRMFLNCKDPFARVSFMNYSDETKKLEKTLCPTWDQTIIFDNIIIHGHPSQINNKPPLIAIEFFDNDLIGSPEFLGRSMATPQVKLKVDESYEPVSLQWFDIRKGNQDGELKGLSQMDGNILPSTPPKMGDIYTVPPEVRPELQRTGIEILCLGLRNMKKYQFSNVTSPSIEFEIGGHVQKSPVIKNIKKNPNFQECTIFFDIMLPKEELYLPPLNIIVRDNRQFGRKPRVGMHTVSSFEKYQRKYQNDQNLSDINDEESAVSDDSETIIVGMTGILNTAMDTIDQPKLYSKKQPLLSASFEENIASLNVHKEKQTSDDDQSLNKNEVQLHSLFFDKLSKNIVILQYFDLWEENIDWWSKYYASLGDLKKAKHYLDLGYSTIEIYTTELEKVPMFEKFTDYCDTFNLQHGKNLDEESSTAGQFKGNIFVYPLPSNPNEEIPEKVLSNVPDFSPKEYLIRIYVIKAFDLQPKDSNGMADPYISIKIGKKKVNNRDSFIPNSVNPTFGCLFELKANIPVEKDVIIKVKDFDLVSNDDVIGETTIDLENRLLSKYKTTVGLAKTYCTSGPNQWRDSLKPTDILKSYCISAGLNDPLFSNSIDNPTVEIGHSTFQLGNFENSMILHKHLGPPKERLALHLLHFLAEKKKFFFVPEHVETRSLYCPLQPGIEQGKLQLFVDMFPLDNGVPPALDITSRKPKKFEIRVVIWNTKEVVLDETSITGEKMSDIYVKGWIKDIDDKQSTDVHYRSLDGEGNFNWRMVFPFDYMPAEELVCVKKKDHFWSLNESEIMVPPTLILQVWDNDNFSSDDFLGTLELNLNDMIKPAKSQRKCNIGQLKTQNDVEKQQKRISLFEQKRLSGFWPVYNEKDGKKSLSGKIEMQIELLSEKEFQDCPAGRGQDEPNQRPKLEKPNRPATSFLWFTSPWKSLKHIIWKSYKWVLQLILYSIKSL
ncbi:DgyrCDS8495 [Dimorphilus gyrociliatus]|uniref:DgyrCDS8495 n=1 Tax=Dimorphilus gyrociliatus TaxID=2664684 RepID=A0A7I8VZG6_9ANNE|nr:DgyrCDS8495 [Dimorphilus gyrociliatus]